MKGEIMKAFLKSLAEMLHAALFNLMAGNGLILGIGQNAFTRYSVYQPDLLEALRGSLYDFQTYAAAGQTVLQFFQVQAGSGGKTLEDTNLTNNGMLPSGISFLVQSIEVFFFPGMLAYLAAGTSPANQIFLNDVWTVGKQGELEFIVGSKSYLSEAPLMRFPPKNSLYVTPAFSDTTTPAANRENRVTYSAFGGKPYVLDPAIFIVSTTNFKVTLNWPSGVQALPSTLAGRIGVVMNGMQVRNSQ
jgi:hypothetical protein